MLARYRYLNCDSFPNIEQWQWLNKTIKLQLMNVVVLVITDLNTDLTTDLTTDLNLPNYTMICKKFLNNVIKLHQIDEGELYNVGIFACRKLFHCCFSYLWPFLPNMTDIRVKFAIQCVSDFDFFPNKLSAIHLAETTGPFLGIKTRLLFRNKFSLAVFHVLCCDKEINKKGEPLTTDIYKTEVLCLSLHWQSGFWRLLSPWAPR